MTLALASVPEQGQLVNVRSRRWVVNDVRASTLPLRWVLKSKHPLNSWPVEIEGERRRPEGKRCP